MYAHRMMLSARGQTQSVAEDYEDRLALLAPREATLLDAVRTPLDTVQLILGHSSPETTRGIYLHSSPARANEAVQKVEDLLTGPKQTQIEEIRNLGSTLIQ
jgi:hypothetical protein